MRNFTSLKPWMILMPLLSLAACGGGGGTGQMTTNPSPTFGDVNSTATSDLVISVLDANSGTVTLESGKLERGADRGTIGNLSGALSADRSQIEVDGGGLVTFAGPRDGYAVRFSNMSSTSTSGIAGIATAVADLPTGTATFSGDTVMTAQEGTDLYDLTGTAVLTATFGVNSPSVTTVLSGLSGVQLPALSDPVSISDAGTLTLSGSAIEGAEFSGGAATLTSNVLTLTGSETVNVEGAFFGPEAVEAGGTFAITGGTTTIFGDFLAER